ncbi:MAG: DUF975 family protein [Candidatus Pacebacteria bacterium]|nr:DUF975 family protein [Candidatus Paceibacterota bacterium]
MTHTFSIKEAIVFGWHKVKAHSQLVFAVVLTMFALQVASSLVEKGLQGTAIGAAASIVLAVLGIILGAGMTLIFLKLAKGEHTQYREIIPNLSLVWKYFLTSLLTGLITLLPLMAGALASLALLVPTGAVNFSERAPVVEGNEWAFAFSMIIMAVALGFAVYFGIRYSMARLAVLEGADVLESLPKSTKLTHNIKWRLVLFALAIAGLNLLGLLALVVGLLVTIPVSVLAFAHVYLKLKSHHGHN